MKNEIKQLQDLVTKLQSCAENQTAIPDKDKETLTDLFKTGAELCGIFTSQTTLF